MVRIRYTIESDGRLVSKPVETIGGVYRTVIERTPAGFDFSASKRNTIEDNESWVVIASGHSRNLTVAKNKAKLLLKEVGVSFVDEVRRRK